jgi:hypothetical protein
LKEKEKEERGKKELLGFNSFKFIDEIFIYNFVVIIEVLNYQ